MQATSTRITTLTVADPTRQQYLDILAGKTVGPVVCACRNPLVTLGAVASVGYTVNTICANAVVWKANCVAAGTPFACGPAGAPYGIPLSSTSAIVDLCRTANASAAAAAATLAASTIASVNLLDPPTLSLFVSHMRDATRAQFISVRCCMRWR